jgi:chromatin modification-related protein YNG2
MRHSLRSDNTDPSSKDKDRTPPSPPAEKVKDAQEKLTALSDEKVALASRIVELLSRKRARLEYDLGRVLVLQGETDPAAIFAGVAASTPVAVSGLGVGAAGYVLGGRNPAAQINESLRNAFAAGAVTPLAGASGSMASVGGRPVMTGEESAYKSEFPEFLVINFLAKYIQERKLMSTQGSIKLPSPAPSLYAPSTRGRRRKRGVSSEADDFDFDYGEEIQGAEEAEAEEGEGEEGEEGEDKELYCFCQKLSYGEMIACDNPDCPYQWVSVYCEFYK